MAPPQDKKKDDTTQPDDGRLPLTLPIPLKRYIYQAAERMGVPASALCRQILSEAVFSGQLEEQVSILERMDKRLSTGPSEENSSG